MRNKALTLVFLVVLFLIVIFAIVWAYIRQRNRTAASEEEPFGKVNEIEKEELFSFDDKNVKLTYSPYFEPYDKEGKTNLRKITDEKAGVYLIRRKGGENVLYVGHSMKNLYKTLYRHFQEWEDPEQIRITYPKKGYEVSIIIPEDESKIQDLEKFLIYELNPQDNTEKYNYYEKQNEDLKNQNEDFTPSEEFEDVSQYQYTPDIEVPF